MTKPKIRTRTSGPHKGKRYPLKNQGPQGYSIAKGNPTSKGATREDLREARLKKLTPFAKMESQWKGDHAGDTDFSFYHSKQEPREFLDDIKAIYDSSADKEGLDHPQKNIISFKGPTDRKIYIGGGNKAKRLTLMATTKSAVENSFTRQEILEIGPLYIHVAPRSKSWAGLCAKRSIKHKTHITGRIRYPHFIHVRSDFLDDESVLVHELEHARQHGFGVYILDRNYSEKMTELSTMARVSQAGVSTAGYYRHIPEVKKALRENYAEGIALLKKLQNEDRKLLTGSKQMKGKNVRERIEELYDKSHISRAKFSPAENLDRYFFIEEADGDELDLHIRYEPKKLPTNKMAYKELKEDYPGAKIWEYRNGKKVRVI